MNGYTLNTRSRRNIKVIKLFFISLIFVSIALVIAVVGCNYVGNRNFKETFYNVSSLKVNNKIRIIQISDLHNCSYGKDNAKMIARVEKLKPDLIVYTGDIIDSKTESVDRVVHLCKALSKVAPSYYIYGNNEVEKYYNNAFTLEDLDKKFGFNDKNRNPQNLLELTDKLTKTLEESGVKVLKNSSDSLTVGSTNIDIYGVLTSNPSAFWPYAGKSFSEHLYTNENNLKITAIHEPILFEEFTPESWGDLLLAGHNHGGTVKIPVIGPLYTRDGGLLPARKGHLVYGRCDVQGSPLIISSGLNNNTLLRINNEPELVIIDINKF